MNYEKATLNELKTIALEGEEEERMAALLELDSRIPRKESK